MPTRTQLIARTAQSPQLPLQLFANRLEPRAGFETLNLRRQGGDTELPRHARCVPFVVEREERGGKVREWLGCKCGPGHNHISFIEFNYGADLGNDCHRLVSLPDGRSVFVSRASAILLSRCEAAKAKAMLHGKTPKSVAPVVGYCRNKDGEASVMTRLEGSVLMSPALFEAIAASGRENSFRLAEISSMPDEYKREYSMKVVAELAKLHSAGMLLGTFRVSDTILRKGLLKFADAAHLSKLSTSGAAVRELFFVLATLVHEGIVPQSEVLQYFKAYSKYKAGKAYLAEFVSAEARKRTLNEMRERDNYASMRGKISLPGGDQLLMSAFERYLDVARLVKRK